MLAPVRTREDLITKCYFFSYIFRDIFLYIVPFSMIISISLIYKAEIMINLQIGFLFILSCFLIFLILFRVCLKYGIYFFIDLPRREFFDNDNSTDLATFISYTTLFLTLMKFILLTIIFTITISDIQDYRDRILIYVTFIYCFVLFIVYCLYGFYKMFTFYFSFPGRYLYQRKFKRIRIQTSEECPICLGEDSSEWIEIILCNHRFHQKCVRQWLREKKTCPICRKVVE